MTAGPGPSDHGSASVLTGGIDIYPSPIQQGKVQPPILPPETLRRDRLLDWLHARIHSRLVLVVAEAGYGKTTLLGDFTRRTRVRCLWYRLDEGDRDSAVLLNHLVAAGRELDPAFAPNTAALLRELPTGGSGHEAILNTFLAELGAWAVGPTALIFDDYHLADGVPEVREVVRRLITRGADRLAIVLSTRRQPALPLARLRALGEVAELETDDLRFDSDETEQLFRETYRLPLEPDVLAELTRHTEGWAATLRLAHVAMRDQSPAQVRRIVGQLSGHAGDVHDYLAEEVVGGLPPVLRAFVSRVSLLAVVTPSLAAAAALVDEAEGRRQLDALEAYGLMGRRGRGAGASRLFHPLVREFLVHRLRDELGEPGVAEVHLRIARAAEPVDWATAAGHYASAGRPADVATVLESALPAIFGQGAYAQAEDLAQALPPELTGPWLDVIRARLHVRRGDIETGRALALSALAHRPEATPSVRALALTVLVGIAIARGDFQEAATRSSELARAAQTDSLKAIAAATMALVRAGRGGSLQDAERALAECAEVQRRGGHIHYEGVSLLNLGWVQRARGQASAAEATVRSAMELLQAISAGQELAAARIILGWSLAHRGDVPGALAELTQAIDEAEPQMAEELLVEAADVVSSYVDPKRAWTLLERARGVEASYQSIEDYVSLVEAETLLRLGNVEESMRLLESVPEEPTPSYPGLGLRRLVALAALACASDSDKALGAARAAHAAAVALGAREASALTRLLEVLTSPDVGAAARVPGSLPIDPAWLSVHAECVARRLDALRSIHPALKEEARRRPGRWLPALRTGLNRGSAADQAAAASLLDEVGELQDVARLRGVARSLRRPDLGRSLARRVADRVFVEDQGRVVLRLGGRVVAGTELRRKVLALLCFLLAQPGLAAARDHVMESLWPGADPEQALNSLHQTAYFLRRAFEEDYVEDLSPGYLHHEGDMVWLDPELVDSRSRRCAALLRGLGHAPTRDDIDRLAAEYQGRFALDFAYEDWASTHRDSIHARYLEAMERALAEEMGSGHLERSVRLAQRLLEVDPDADEVEVTLLRLYRATGAHAAAAEQYGHYATVMREQLGIEPPPLDQL